MYKILENIKTGIENPYAITSALIRKRAINFDVSDFKRLAADDLFNVSIQHLQGDNCEGRFLLSGRNNGSLLLHNIKNVTPSLEFECTCLWKKTKFDKDGHQYSVECVRWFPLDNGIFVTASLDKSLKIWDTSCLECVETHKFEVDIYNFDLSPSRTRNCTVAVCGKKGTVSILELHSGTNVHTLSHHQGHVLTCNWSPFEEHILATGASDNKVLLWDVRAAKSCLMSLNRCNTKQTSNCDPCMNKFTAHTGSVNCVKFVKGGLKLVSCGTDNVIRLWDTLSGKNELIDYASFSNDSKKSIHIDISKFTTPELMYVPCFDNINIYEIESGELLKTLSGHCNKVNCCYYEPFQHELYSGCKDGIINVWWDNELSSIASQNCD